MGIKKMSNTSKLSKINEPVQVLRKIQRVSSNAIIAGGYFRDKFNEVPYSDIDVYIQQPDAFSAATNFTDMEFWKEYFNLNVEDWKSQDDISDLSETDEEYDIVNNSNIIAVFEMTKNELAYNLIVVNTDPVEYVTEHFDFGICKTWCDGEKITFTKEFMSDVEHNTLTYTEEKVSPANFNHAMHIHLAKLQRKYPQHTLVIPDKHQQMYQTFKRQFT